MNGKLFLKDIKHVRSLIISSDMVQNMTASCPVWPPNIQTLSNVWGCVNATLPYNIRCLIGKDALLLSTPGLHGFACCCSGSCFRTPLKKLIVWTVNGRAVYCSCQRITHTCCSALCNHVSLFHTWNDALWSSTLPPAYSNFSLRLFCNMPETSVCLACTSKISCHMTPVLLFSNGVVSGT